MASEVEFYQIYYKPEHTNEIYPFAIPYFNESLTLFFENSIIADLVPKSNADKIAVCSWALNHKRAGMNTSNRQPLREEDLHLDYDVAAFTRNTGTHQMLEAMDNWHKGSKELLKKICNEIGVPFPKEVKYPIYQNAFCARREIYLDYVLNVLGPAMEVMETKFKDECMQDSGYYKLKHPGEDYAQRIKKYLGLDYCPMYPFLLERLFSVWIGDKFKVIYV